jgi:hypothetical protein
MEKYVTPGDHDSLADVQEQIDRFIQISEAAESLISSGLMKGIFDITLKMPENLVVAIYSRDVGHLHIADKFENNEVEKTGMIIFDHKFPLVVNEISAKRNESNPNKVSVNCINSLIEGSRVRYIANNLSDLIFAVKY